mmetsp:Transcript_26159/g.62362  ORF Transcript_26159/g.62362 Transcript_26159/m.62362 type:complete len:454 (-) Transcript_26159:3290-4651(-)
MLAVHEHRRILEGEATCCHHVHAVLHRQAPRTGADLSASSAARRAAGEVRDGWNPACHETILPGLGGEVGGDGAIGVQEHLLALGEEQPHTGFIEVLVIAISHLHDPSCRRLAFCTGTGQRLRQLHHELVTADLPSTTKRFVERRVSCQHEDLVAIMRVPQEVVFGSLAQEPLGGLVHAERVAITEVASQQIWLRVDITPLGPQTHWIDRVHLALHVLDVASRPLLVKAGEDPREVHDVLVAVSRDRAALAVQHPGAVGIQAPKPNSEELHDLTCIVFVWVCTITVEGPIPLVREVVAHDRTVCDLAQDVPEVPKCVPHKDVVKVHIHLGVTRSGIIWRYDENLGQRPRHALAELIRGLKGQHGPDGGPAEVGNLCWCVVIHIEGGVQVVLRNVEGVLMARCQVVGHLSRRTANFGKTIEALKRTKGRRQRKRLQSLRQTQEAHRVPEAAHEV